MLAAVTLYEYAQIANQVYEDQASFQLAGWVCQRFKMDKPVFKGGEMFSDGFQGGSFYNRDSNHLVIGFKGTVPSMASDLMQDLRIATGRIPNQAESALTYVELWREAQPGATVSLVGHSLGGGLCQVVGSWLNLPFVTFNAPAMGANWFLAHFDAGLGITEAHSMSQVLDIIARTPSLRDADPFA